MNGLPSRRSAGPWPPRRIGRGSPAFSLLELLVVLAVATILLSLLMPGFYHVRESARRFACASNQRQMGLGLAGYVEDHKDLLPHSTFADLQRPQDMSILYRSTRDGRFWDGLGKLFEGRRILTPETFYCPSHRGTHQYREYIDDWVSPGYRRIIGNYHYRGIFRNEPITKTRFTALQTIYQPVLIADGLRSKSAFSHVVGTNILQADLSVVWLPDPEKSIYGNLPSIEGDPWQRMFWKDLDDGPGFETD